MVADEPHDPLRNKTFQEVCPVGFVLGGAEPLAHVMEERCGVQLGVIGFASRVFEHLERVIERVALGMISRILGDAIEAVEQVEEFFTHRWDRRGKRRRVGTLPPEVRGHTHSAGMNF